MLCNLVFDLLVYDLWIWIFFFNLFGSEILGKSIGKNCSSLAFTVIQACSSTTDPTLVCCLVGPRSTTGLAPPHPVPMPPSSSVPDPTTVSDVRAGSHLTGVCKVSRSGKKTVNAVASFLL